MIVKRREGTATDSAEAVTPSRFRSLAFHLTLIVMVLIVWELAVATNRLPVFVLGRPMPVLKAFFAFMTSTATMRHVGITALSLALGLLTGGVAGLAAAIFVARLKGPRDALEPLILTLYTIPRLALVPLFLIWFGFGMTPQVLVAAIHAFVIFYLATVAAIDALPSELLLNVRSMGGNVRHRSRFVTVPYSAPYLASALRQALALGLGSVIIAEMLGPRGGIGFLLRDRLGLFDTTGVVALILVASSLGVVLDRLGWLIERRSLRWS